MRTIRVILFEIIIGGVCVATRNLIFYHGEFNKIMSKIKRKQLREVAKKHGLPCGGDKEAQIWAIWNSDKKIKINIRI